MLTLDFLRSGISAGAYLAELAGEASAYSGFNLLLADGKELFYYSNIEGSPRSLEPGVYGLSNALLNTPWPKLNKGRSQLQHLLRETDPSHAQLQAVVSDHAPEADENLPDTGVGVEMERMLSAQFIRTAEYGTRATTSLMLNAAGGASFCENSFNAGGEHAGIRQYDFSPDGGE